MAVARTLLQQCAHLLERYVHDINLNYFECTGFETHAFRQYTLTYVPPTFLKQYTMTSSA